MGYWIARSHWGRGLATEACEALVDIARTLGFSQLEGSHFVDNPASGRVLEKLGFEPLGIIAPRLSCARGVEVPARLMRQDGVTGVRAWSKLLWYLWVRPGMFRKIAGAWLKFFLPGFHPWNEDDRHLLRAYEANAEDAPQPARKVRRAV